MPRQKDENESHPHYGHGGRSIFARPLALSLSALLAVASCSDSGPAAPVDPIAPADPVTPPPPPPPLPPPSVTATLTLDAADDWAFADFDGEVAMPVSVSDPTTSEAWDLGLYATSVMLNGGDAGPGGVLGHCICQNGEVSDAEVQELDAEQELTAFEAVTADDIPTAEDAWLSDSLQPAITDWYSYDFTTHTLSAAPERVWYVRTASGDAFAKLHVVDIANPARTHAGEVTVEFALQRSAGAEFEAVQTIVMDASAGDQYLDLETGSVVTESDGWDLWLTGFYILVNGGVSGEGRAGAVLTDEDFGTIADVSGAPASVYAADKYGGVFAEHRWYRYNLQGNHQIWPTFDVFLIRSGEDTYKVQLTSYYGPTGDSRQITFRYELL